ncbi:hypothetical protein ACYCAX_25800 [Pseudomonas sp. MT3]|nr:hypothetical protein [uncultured Pseudomonas sp.]
MSHAQNYQSKHKAIDEFAEPGYVDKDDTNTWCQVQTHTSQTAMKTSR